MERKRIGPPSHAARRTLWSRRKIFSSSRRSTSFVALTNGRISFFRDDGRGRDTARPDRTLFRLRDFMFRRGHFALHLPQFYALRDTARFVEEINDAARCTADQNHEKAHRSDQFRD